MEWVVLLLTTLTLTRISIVESRRGNTAVWRTALSRYNPKKQSRDFIQETSSFYRGSSIFGFDRTNGHQKNLSMASRDWFAPAELAIRSSDNVDSQRDDVEDSYPGAGKAGLGAYGNGNRSVVPPLQQLQTPNPTRPPAVIKTIDGFEIVSTGYYEGNWNQGGPHSRT